MDLKKVSGKGGSMLKKDFLKFLAVFCGVLILGSPMSLWAESKPKISIATGGMGGVYFVMGGGLATLLTKYADVEATAEVTAASVDNCKLLGAKKADIGFVLADTGFDAFKGTGAFKSPIPVRVLAVIYPNKNHVVTIEGKGIKQVSDLKGKRVSTGSPGSGTEVVAFRILEAAGLDPKKDITVDRLGVAESGGALKDGKIDAYVWSGGVPTAAVLDVSASPGIKMALVSHGDLVDKMNAKYGNIYYQSNIPKEAYTGISEDIIVSTVPNVLLCHQEMDEKMAYNVVKTLFDKLPELVAIHKEANNINMKTGASSTFIPYHKGAAKFFSENGIKVFE
ncbi:MAG: TAXI family TRAP transporter solute-binding subunit [Desulfobacula sp.]|jgi:hypothetical protein